MNRIARTVFLRSLAAIFCAGIALTARAAGLGAINMQSVLGQPLAAEIEITSLQAGEFDEIKGSIAGLAAYESAKLHYIPAFRQIRISTDRRADGRPILKLSSNTPINEPAIDLMVELTWPTGKVTQKYSVLLDPAK
ncbi:MAG TPA: hypothetical protein VF928_11690 [Usitatibacteraceae bacterium]